MKCTSLVTRCRAQSAFAPDYSSSVSANRRRAGADYQRDGRAFRHGGKHEVEVGSNVYESFRKLFLQELQHANAVLFAAGTGETRAQRHDLKFDSRGICGGTGGFLQCRERRGEADACWIGSWSSAAGENGAGFAQYHTLGFRAAAIESQETLHKASLREKFLFESARALKVSKKAPRIKPRAGLPPLASLTRGAGASILDVFRGTGVLH